MPDSGRFTRQWWEEWFYFFASWRSDSVPMPFICPEQLVNTFKNSGHLGYTPPPPPHICQSLSCSALFEEFLCTLSRRLLSISCSRQLSLVDLESGGHKKPHRPWMRSCNWPNRCWTPAGSFTPCSCSNLHKSLTDWPAPTLATRSIVSPRDQHA